MMLPSLVSMRINFDFCTIVNDGCLEWSVCAYIKICVVLTGSYLRVGCVLWLMFLNVDCKKQTRDFLSNWPVYSHIRVQQNRIFYETQDSKLTCVTL